MTNTRWIALTFGLALAACGGSQQGTNDAAPVDALPGPPRAVVVAGDFEPGNPGALSTVDLMSRTIQTKVGPPLAVGDDPILRHFGNELFIVNRSDGNNVTILDDQTLELKAQIGTGTNTNPQDVAAIGDKLYVATFNGKGLVMLTRGLTAITEIDLSRDDPDGRPNCNSVYRVGNDVYVSCGLLDDAAQLAPRGPGKVYVVDSATNTVKTTLTLSTKNPFGLFEQIPASAPNAGDLLIPTVLFNFGEADDGTGCIERITPGAAPTAQGCLVNNTAIEGFASGLAFLVEGGAGFIWVATPRAFPMVQVRVYDMSSNSFWPGSINASTQVIGDLALCPTGEFILTDKAGAGGLRIYGGNSLELTTAAMPVGFIPQSSHGLACY